MRIFILALVVIAGLLFFDSCAANNDPLADTQRWQAYSDQRQFNDQYRPVLDAVSLAWIVLPLVILAGGALIAIDAYLNRRKPIVLTDSSTVAIRRDSIHSDEALRLQVELARLRLEVQAVAAAHQVPQSMSLSYRGEMPDVATLDTPAATLPTAPPLRDLVAGGFTPTMQRVILGYGVNGPVYAPLSGLLSTAVAGRPGQGKSTLLRLVAYQTIAAGGAVYLLDPHGSIADDVKDAPVKANAGTARELADVSGVLLEELDKRLHRYRAGRRDFSPILALVDELPAVALASKPAMNAAGRLVLEGRKVGMYCFVSGQGLPAQQFGGRLVRDALSSRYIFKTSADEARRCGLPTEAARQVLDLRPGVAIVDAGVLSAPEVLAIPNCTGADFAHLETGGSGQSNDADVVSAHLETGGSGDARVAEVREMVRNGMPQNEIIKALWGATGGRAYQAAAEELRAILAGLV